MLLLIQALVLWGLHRSCVGAPVNSDVSRRLGPGGRGEARLHWNGVHLNDIPEITAELESHTIPHDNSKHEKVDLVETKMMALMTSAVYCHNMTGIHNWTCSVCKDPLVKGFKVHTVVDIDAWDLYGYIGYFPATNAKAILFRGTNKESIWNWVEDLRAERSSFPLKIPGSEGAMVHTGFSTLWNSSGAKKRMTMAFVELLQKTRWGGTLYVGGHSMGAAVASLCALYMKHMFQLKDVRVYTFGSPRVGNAKFVELYTKMIPVNVRVTHMEDIVPSVPVNWLGYQHLPTEVWQTDRFNATTNTTEFSYKICNGSGEDPTCHLSMCGWGICTNVEQHTTYMGLPMRHEVDC